MDNNTLSFEVQIDKTLTDILSLSDQELLNLPANPELESTFETFSQMNDAYLEACNVSEAQK